MSHKKIRIPPQVGDRLAEDALTAARVVASSLVGLAVVALVFAVAALTLLLLFAGGLVSPWLACAVPTCSAVGLAVVAAGVALDVLRGLRRE